MANREERVVDCTNSTTSNPRTADVGPAPEGREKVLIRAFVGLADTLVDDYDTIDLLDRLAGYSVELLVADAAGIMLGDAQRRLRVVASSNEQSDWMELLQLAPTRARAWTATAAAPRSPSSTSPPPQRAGPGSAPP